MDWYTSQCRDKLVQYARHSTSSVSMGLDELKEKHATDREVSWQIRDCWLFDTVNEPSVGHDHLIYS
jgi:hypothetical protein